MSTPDRSRPPHVVIFTPWFYPHLGGVETVTDLLATGLCAIGCPVTMITTYPSNQLERTRPYALIRQSGIAAAWRAVRAADVVLMFGASLRFIWLPLLLRKPLVVNHYTWTPWRTRPSISLVQRVLCLAAHNVTPSKVMTQHFGPRTQVLPNPFDDRTFHLYPDVPRDRELVYLGRLVEEKGLQVLLDALRILKTRGMNLPLTVIGSGPAEQQFRKLAVDLDVHDNLVWRGPMSGEALARELAGHKVQVVPSLWREPFGIVAVEGLACGCEVVVSSHGGLLEAAGDAGIPFAAGDGASLADAIARAWQRANDPRRHGPNQTHVAQFRVERVARVYVDFFRSLDYTR